MSIPNTAEPSSVSEADYKKAEELIVGYIDEYHQTLYWYLQKNCHTSAEMAEDTLQNLWLHVFQQLSLGRRDKMYKSYLFNKARWIHSELQRKISREDPMDMGSIDFRGEDDLEKHEDQVVREMLKKSKEDAQSASLYDGGIIRAEPTNETEEKALYKSFWANYPEVELTEEQKEVAFELFRYGLTLKEVSEKRGVAISTLSDWKRKIEDEVERAHNEEEDHHE